MVSNMKSTFASMTWQSRVTNEVAWHSRAVKMDFIFETHLIPECVSYAQPGSALVTLSRMGLIIGYEISANYYTGTVVTPAMRK